MRKIYIKIKKFLYKLAAGTGTVALVIFNLEGK